jgi:hypothetical protein
MGEVFAAKQRLGVNPYVETPFQMEGAIEVYAALFDARQNDEWKAAGFRSTGWDSYVQTLHHLWEEIQETHLNAADYYLSRSLKEPGRSDGLVRSAARMYARYLSFFQQFATPDSREFVPDSAYFAAYECARGFGDAYLKYAVSNPTATEVDLAVQRYVIALRTYPFDRRLWPALTTALERKGQSNDFMGLARPLADAVVRSRDVHKWIQAKEPGAEGIGAMRRALADDLVLMYLGFADAEATAEVERSLRELQTKRDSLRDELTALRNRRDRMDSGGSSGAAVPAKRASTPVRASRTERTDLTREIHRKTDQLAKLERQVKARARAVPLYRATHVADGLIDELRSQRDHPVHTLLRRMYHERRSAGSLDDDEGRS